MQLLYPGAKWRPLGPQTEPSIGVPRQLIWHTMVGTLSGTDSYFRQQGYTGDESTFGVGGPWGENNDGVIFQWQVLDHQADAQYAGNYWATSIETADGGDPSRPWTSRQIEAMVNLAVWWCGETHVDPYQCSAYNTPGFGYHELFPEWNRSGHRCPGVIRENQLKAEVWPEIRRRIVRPVPKFPVFPLPRGWYFGPASGPRESVSGLYSHREDLAQWQRQLSDRGWAINVNGFYSPTTASVARQFQEEKGLHVDSLIGKETWDAAWTTPVTP